MTATDLSQNSYSNPLAYPNTLITRQEAQAALASVGRVPLGAWQKFPRPAKSSALMDDLESRWWNRHAAWNEKVHSMPDDVCWALRGHYMTNARQFFLSGRNQATILELGCGSGWFGRLIAGPDLHIIGMDGSHSQVELARQNARKSAKSDFCQYFAAMSIKKIPDLARVNGVIIQGFLHHLYGDELAQLFAELGAFLPQNTRLYVVEPVYHNFSPACNSENKAAIEESLQGLKEAITTIRNETVAARLFDVETEQQTMKIIKEADQLGFFCSPKEVVADVAELRQILEKYAIISQEVITGIFDFDAAQLLAHITDAGLRQELTESLMPMARHLDNFIIANNCIGSFSRDRYLFTAFECDLLSKSTSGNPMFKPTEYQSTQAGHQPSSSQNMGVYDYGKNYYGRVILTPQTLVNIATAPETWAELLSFHNQLATDDYVGYLDAYYRTCLQRFGKYWFYLDITNVIFAASKTLQPTHYLEIGVRRGRSVCVAARGCSRVNIFAFDMWVQNYAGMENPGADFVQTELKKHNHQGNVTFINGDSHVTIPRFFQQNPQILFDMITVDGDHSAEGALDDLRNVIPHLAPAGVLIFDDIAHDQHAYLLDVWRQAMTEFPNLIPYEFRDAGYGVAFAIRKG